MVEICSVILVHFVVIDYPQVLERDKAGLDNNPFRCDPCPLYNNARAAARASSRR